jgi:hypothetical protein
VRANIGDDVRRDGDGACSGDRLLRPEGEDDAAQLRELPADVDGPGPQVDVDMLNVSRQSVYESGEQQFMSVVAGPSGYAPLAMPGARSVRLLQPDS